MKCLGKTLLGRNCTRTVSTNAKHQYCYQHGGDLHQLPPTLDREYELLDQIDCGAMGCVYRVRNRILDILRAIKVIDYSKYNTAMRNALVLEVNTMFSLKDHPNNHVVQFVKRYVDRDASTIYIVMEYVSTSVEKYLKAHPTIPDELTLKVARQTLEGLVFLQSRGIIHNDLKPGNLLLDDDLNVIIADFGMICQLKPFELFCADANGTPLYMSPEKLHERPFDYKADLWALGVILYQMIMGELPFNPPPGSDAHFGLTMLVDRGIYLPIIDHHPLLVSLIRDLLQVHPANRPSAAELLDKYWKGCINEGRV